MKTKEIITKAAFWWSCWIDDFILVKSHFDISKIISKQLMDTMRVCIVGFMIL